MQSCHELSPPGTVDNLQSALAALGQGLDILEGPVSLPGAEEEVESPPALCCLSSPPPMETLKISLLWGALQGNVFRLPEESQRKLAGWQIIRIII